MERLVSHMTPFEKIEPIQSDPSGVEALREFVEHAEQCILRVCRLPAPVTDNNDIHYAERIEQLRKAGRIS